MQLTITTVITKPFPLGVFFSRQELMIIISCVIIGHRTECSFFFSIHFRPYLANIYAALNEFWLCTFKNCCARNLTYQKLGRSEYSSTNHVERFIHTYYSQVVPYSSLYRTSSRSRHKYFDFFSHPFQLQFLCNDEVVNPLSTMKFIWIAHWRRKVKNCCQIVISNTTVKLNFSQQLNNMCSSSTTCPRTMRFLIQNKTQIHNKYCYMVGRILSKLGAS